MSADTNMAEEVAAKIAVESGPSIFSIFKTILVNWRISLTLLFLVIYLSSSIIQCVNERSFSPLVFGVGGRILSSDETLYWKLNKIEANGWKLVSSNMQQDEPPGLWHDVKSVFAKIGFVFDIITSLWFIYMVIFLFSRFIGFFNVSGTWLNWVAAAIIVMFLQALYGSAMLYINYECNKDHTDACLTQPEKYKNAVFALTPLKGCGKLVYHLFFTREILDALTESAIPPLEKPVNQTI